MTFGWFSAPAAFASCSKRCRRAGSLATFGVEHLQRHVARQPLVARTIDLAHAAAPRSR